MSGGSGSSKVAGRPLWVYYSPVNVKAPESLMNSERAAIPWGFPGALGGQARGAPFAVSFAGFRNGRMSS